MNQRKIISIFEAIGYGAGAVIQASNGFMYSVGCLYIFGQKVQLRLVNDLSLPKLFSVSVYDLLHNRFINDCRLVRPSLKASSEVTIERVDWETDNVLFKGFIIGRLFQKGDDMFVHFFNPSLEFTEDLLKNSFTQKVSHVKDAKNAACLHLTTINPSAFDIKSNVKTLVEECLA